MQFALRTQAYVGGLAQKLKIPPIEANIFIQTVFISSSSLQLDLHCKSFIFIFEVLLNSRH